MDTNLSLSYLALHLYLSLHTRLLTLFFLSNFFLQFVFFEKGRTGPPHWTLHTTPGDTHVNLSRLKASLNRLIRKSVIVQTTEYDNRELVT